MRSALPLSVLMFASVLVACGGDDSGPQPEPAYANAAGVYTISGTFDGIPSADASFTGSITITQASREAPALGGTGSITATIAGDVFPVSSSLSDATLTTNGQITFVMGGGGVGWSFAGQLSGNTAGGRHTLTDGSSSFSGDFSMTRPSANVRMIRSTEGPSDFRALWKALR